MLKNIYFPILNFVLKLKYFRRNNSIKTQNPEFQMSKRLSGFPKGISLESLFKTRLIISKCVLLQRTLISSFKQKNFLLKLEEPEILRKRIDFDDFGCLFAIIVLWNRPFRVSNVKLPWSPDSDV